MADIRNYTMNFSAGRPPGLTCLRKLTCTDIHCGPAIRVACSER
jgi:hypothetical protein